jgi:hypothetical protein
MNTQANIINIQDAKAMKKMGSPLNTPAEKPEFSLAYSKHWVELMNAHTQFVTAVQEYSRAKPGARSGKWTQIRRRLEDIGKAMVNWQEVISMVDEATKFKFNPDKLPLWFNDEVIVVTEMRGQN